MTLRWWHQPPTIEALRKRAGRELIINRSITVYGFVDGAEVNRCRPLITRGFHRLTEQIIEMRNTIQVQLFDGLADAAKKFASLSEALNARR